MPLSNHVRLYAYGIDLESSRTQPINAPWPTESGCLLTKQHLTSCSRTLSGRF